MNKVIEKIKKNKLMLIFIIFFVILMVVNINKNAKLLKFFYNKYNTLNPEFSFSIFNKSIINDTFFTLATGQYMLENGNDNMDHLTWHENLEYPHSRSI